MNSGSISWSTMPSAALNARSAGGKFHAQKVDAIILNPCEVEASSPVTKALAAGIPIINVNSETKVIPAAFSARAMRNQRASPCSTSPTG
jgi:hypothetical protein